MNPVNGGIPASDRRQIAIIKAVTVFILNMLYIVLIVFELIMFMIKKIGMTITEYIRKYIIQNDSLLIDNIDVIHPIWPIEEYASSGRRWVWFIPITPPISALTLAVIAMIILDSVLVVVIIRSESGANFCHVDNVRQLIHDSDDITEGYQKWHGAIPSLINIAVIIIHMGSLCITGWYSIDIPSNINMDPRACDRKYLIEASVSWFDFVIIIRGMNLSMLISSMIHAINQLGLIIVNTVLINNVVYIAHRNGVWLSIKIWRSWTPY